MAKEFKKAVSGYETELEHGQEAEEITLSKEEEKEFIRKHEEDFIQGLIDASEFSTEETQRIEIVREGRLYFAFRIRPLSSEEYDKCRRKHTKYVRNKNFGIKMPQDTDRIKYQSALIYQATVEEDRENLWDNRKVWNALNAKKDRIINGLDVVECVLKAGEKDKILEAIDKISGFEENLEEEVKN